MITLKSISVGYGRTRIIRDVSLHVQQGEFCALVGRNGSGKTTLLKGICGLLPIQSGTCIINGADFSRLNERERARYCSYLPQRFSTIYGVSVLDVVLMGFYSKLAPFSFPTVDDKALAMNVLEQIGIGDLVNCDFAKLSEGQKQMTVLARTLIQDAPVMLMDEPDSALDFVNRHLLLTELRRIVRNSGKTALITVHDPNQALRYCDRIIGLSSGKIVSDQTLQNADKEDIERCLTVVYGDVTVYRNKCEYAVNVVDCSGE